MKSDSKQTSLFIGIALIVVAVILIVYAVALPRVYHVEESVSVVETATLTQPQTQQDNAAVQFPLNLNTATAEELSAIEGIGRNRANAIIEYREYLGGYTSVEQLMDIEGFGEVLYEELAPYLTVE